MKCYAVALIAALTVVTGDVDAHWLRGRQRCCPMMLEAPPSPATAIRAVLNAQVAAWNRGDLEGFMAGYWHSDDLTFMSGNTVTHGWQSTLDRYRARYQGEGKEMGSLTFSDIEIQVLDGDNAMVRGRWTLVKKAESPGGLFTLILKRFPEGWRIVHDHTSG
jgi:beta-aspartyl-peptidase (threonine type)